MSIRPLDADPGRNSGVRRATFVFSLLLHAGLFGFLAFYRMPVHDQQILSPISMVELSEPSRTPRERSRLSPPRPEPAAPRQEESPAPAKPEPRAATKVAVKLPPKSPGKSPSKTPPAPVPMPTPRPAPAPAPVRETLPTIAKRPEDTPPPVRSKPPEKSSTPASEFSEEDLRKRLKAIRERVGSTEAGSTAKPSGTESDVSSSIARIRAKVGEVSQPAKPQTPRPAPRPVVGEAGVVDGGPSSGSVIADMRFAAYRAKLWSHVKAHWSLPPSLAGRGLSTVVVASVSRNGVVSNANVEISSGVEAFDLMALRALLNSSPLPEIPADIPDAAIADGLGFRFTEAGGQ